MWDLHPQVAPHVARMGFYAWTLVQNMRVDHALITALVERWRSETHTFHFRGGEMTVSLQDVALLTGLPVDGFPVTGNESCPDWGHVCEQLLGRDPERGRSPYYVHFSWFAEHMSVPPADADEELLVQFARAYVLCMLSTSLLTDSTGNEVSLHFLWLLGDVDAVAGYSWGAAVLACLYRQLCTACAGRHKQIGGALLLLQFWCWERMPLGRPRQVGLPDHQWPEGFGGEPRMLPPICYGRWAGTRSYTQSPHQVLLYYRDHLDRQSPGDLSWEPYHDDRIEGLNELCVQGRDIWTAEVPLICFHIVEWHYPSRVMRQFGWQPLIPDPPRDGHSDLHKVTRRKGKLDWAVEHERWIALWHQRHNQVIAGSVLHDPHMHSSYMAWYDRITRRIIQPPHFHMNAYQPTAGERTTLVSELNLFVDRMKRCYMST